MNAVTLQNVHVGQKVQKGQHWNPNWKFASRGIVLGYTDSGGILVGLNNKNESDDKRRCFWTLQGERNLASLQKPWEYGAKRSKSGDLTTLGPAWCTVAWENIKTIEILPIGATGPLGKWWTNEKYGFGKPCFSLAFL